MLTTVWLIYSKRKISRLWHFILFFQGKGKEKGALELTSIKGIEEVDYEAFGRNSSFQVNYLFYIEWS